MDFSAISAQSFIGRWLRSLLRLVPPGVAVPILQGPLRGMRWIVGAGNHSCWLGCYETNKQKHLAARVRPGDVVYDLGANSGYFTLVNSVLVGDKGQVVSFEPLPANLAFLHRHLALNAIRNCSVVEAAISSREGFETFLSGNDTSQGRLTSEGDAGTQGTGIRVRVLTLDGMIARGEIPPPALIKCDVEGAELEVLRGAAHLLARRHPIIFLDLHTEQARVGCMELLRGLGYEVAPLDGFPLAESAELIAEWTGASR